MSTCCVLNCPNGSGSAEPETRFHRMPIKNPARLEQWCSKLRIKFNTPKLSKLQVCERHFSCMQYRYITDIRRHLLSNAVPDQNLPKKQKKPPKKNNNDGFNPPSVLVLDNLDRVCRMCLEADEQGSFESIFAKDEIVDYIQHSIGIQIQQTAGYPTLICSTCIDRVTYIHRSREWFHKNDQLLKTIVSELDQKVSPAAPDESQSDIIIPDVIPTLDINAASVAEIVKEETQLMLPDGTSIFKSEDAIIEAEEVTLEQLGIIEEQQPELESSSESSEDEEDQSEPDEEEAERERAALIGRRFYLCDCGTSYLNETNYKAHLAKAHGVKWTEGYTNPSKVPPKPLVLEEMAAVFNSMTGSAKVNAGQSSSSSPPENASNSSVAKRPKRSCVVK